MAILLPATPGEPSDCPPGTFNGDRSVVCQYPQNEAGGCDFGGSVTGNHCKIDPLPEGRCWKGVNSAGQCIDESRSITCEDGETASPNEGNNGLICTSEGDPIETEVNCE